MTGRRLLPRARYLIRLDDACPTMQAAAWEALEAAFDRLAIRPIVGVIPDNRDPALACDPPDAGFWDTVRRWESKRWTIALHGLHHTYHPMGPTGQALVPLHQKSEFVGLPLEQQCTMLRQSWAVFRQHGVRPTVFMAPSHTFDSHTLAALRRETDIDTVTDGLALQPFHRAGLRWIPQQLWRLRRMPFGVWTVCLHPNAMSDDEVKGFIARLEDFAADVVSVPALEASYRPAVTWIDRGFEALFLAMMRWKRRWR